jgi:hypothetical protein
MIKTPHEAWASTKGVTLTEEELQTVFNVEKAINDFLVSDKWAGGQAQIMTEPLNGKQASWVIRECSLRGWQVVAGAVNGKLADAPAILAKGGSVPFVLQLTPRWLDAPRTTAEALHGGWIR